MKIQGRNNFDNGEQIVLVDGKKLYHDYSCTIINHSPLGFSWGYGGSGPAQLALSLLLLITDKESAQALYQKFKWEFIATLPQDNFDVNLDIEEWVREQGHEINNLKYGMGFLGKDKDVDSQNGHCTFQDRCQKADWKQCDCSCGGVNHGIQTKMFD